MSDNVEGFAGPLTVLQFKGGQSNPTYRVDTDRASYVLRRKPPGDLLKGAHAIDREFRVLAALHKAEFPVPRVYALCLDRSVIGTEFYVMDRIEGRVFWNPTPARGGSTRTRGLFRRHERDDRPLARHRSVGHRPGRLRSDGRLLRATDRALVRAVSGRHARGARSEHGPVGRMAAATYSRRRRDDDLARRLPLRQHDLPPDRAARPGGAGLGALDAGPPSRRLHVPVDAMDDAGSRQCRSQGAGTFRARMEAAK